MVKRKGKPHGRLAPQPGYDRDRLEHVEGGKPKVASGPNVVKSGTITLPPGSIPSPSGGKSSALDFSDALMRGNPIALRAAEEALRSPEVVGGSGRIYTANEIDEALKKVEEPSLADRFIARTFTEADDMRGKSKKMMEEAMLHYRREMKAAHRFVLDDQFVDLATRMATVRAEKILARLQYSTIPYDVTWIEFNLHQKMRTIQELHGRKEYDLHDVSPRLGMLLQRIDDTSAVCTLVSEVEDIPTVHLCAYFFSTTEIDFSIRPGTIFGCKPMVLYIDEQATDTDESGFEVGQHDPPEIALQRAHSQSLGKASMWGYVTPSADQLPDHSKLDPENIRTPDFLLRHGDVGLSRVFSAYNHIGKKKELADLTLSELREFTGQIRWLVTVLAMLNEVPVNNQLISRSGHVRAGTFRKLPYLDYHKLTLRLPKTRPLPYLERKLSNVEATKRRAHEVRSHWRTYLHVEHCLPDEHAWEYDNEHGYALCGKCMAFRRRIHEHVRGDPSLGWVQKEYLIKPAKQE